MTRRENRAKRRSPGATGLGRSPETLRRLRLLVLTLFALAFSAWVAPRWLVSLTATAAIAPPTERGNMERCAPPPAHSRKPLVLELQCGEPSSDAEPDAYDPTDDATLSVHGRNTLLGLRGWARHRAVALDPSRFVDRPGLPRGPPA